MSTTATTENTLKTMSVKDFMLSNNFTQVVKAVRENENNYPYVTFINSENRAENVYFSKSESTKFMAGQAIEKGFFDKLQIAETTNADGEVRMKLVGIGGNRVSIEDLF